MEVSDTSPGWEKVEQCMKQLSRTTLEDKVEQQPRTIPVYISLSIMRND